MDTIEFLVSVFIGASVATIMVVFLRYIFAGVFAGLIVTILSYVVISSISGKPAGTNK